MAEDNNDQNVVQPQNNAQQAVPTQPADVATDNAETSVTEPIAVHDAGEQPALPRNRSIVRRRNTAPTERCRRSRRTERMPRSRSMVSLHTVRRHRRCRRRTIAIPSSAIHM